MGKKFKKRSHQKKQGGLKDKPREILTNHSDTVPCSTAKPIDKSPKKRIVVISHSSPMRFNRSFFQLSSEHMREQGFNYYLTTKILQPVKNIKDQPNYKEMYTKLLMGFFKPDIKDPEPVFVEKIDPLICLTAKGKFKTSEHIKGEPCRPDQEPYSLLVRDVALEECEPFKGTTGVWQVLYYLYRVYELHGLGDLAIDGQPYRVRLHPDKDWKEDLVLAQQFGNFIIGRLIA